MAILTWDQTGQRFYETGVSKGVLFLPDNTGAYKKGVAWNGLATVTEKPTGAESNATYADNIKYLNLVSAEEFGATIEAFTYPEEFAECDGTKAVKKGVFAGQQTRKRFAFSYQTLIGNDVDGTDKGFKIHIVYNCLASPSERAYSTVNDNPEAISFSWDVSTTPVSVTTEGVKPLSLLTIDSTKVTAADLKKLTDKLYGTATEEPSLPVPDEVIKLFTAA